MLLLAQAGLTLGLGVAGWIVATRLRFPAAAILGPMLFVGAAAALGVQPISAPAWIKLLLQIVIGTFIGYRVDRQAVMSARSLVRPIALTTVWMISSAVVIGLVLAWAGHVDLTSALLSTTPGGIAEMSAMAMGVHANVAFVATLQALRIMTTMLVFPLYVRHHLAREMNPTPPTARRSPLDCAKLPGPCPDEKKVPWIACVALGTAGGLVCNWLQVPVAGVLGAMLAVGVAQVVGIRFAEPPSRLRVAAQAGIGILIGATLTGEALAELGSQLVPMLLATAATVASGLVLARVVQAWMGSDVQTAFLACAPAGLTQMGAIAEEFGAQVFVVSIFQLARLLCAILVLPFGFRLLLWSG